MRRFMGKDCEIENAGNEGNIWYEYEWGAYEWQEWKRYQQDRWEGDVWRRNACHRNGETNEWINNNQDLIFWLSHCCIRGCTVAFLEFHSRTFMIVDNYASNEGLIGSRALNTRIFVAEFNRCRWATLFCRLSSCLTAEHCDTRRRRLLPVFHNEGICMYVLERAVRGRGEHRDQNQWTGSTDGWNQRKRGGSGNEVWSGTATEANVVPSWRCPSHGATGKSHNTWIHRLRSTNRLICVEQREQRFIW